MNRFLILGTEGGSFYVSEKAMTVANAQATIRCIKEDGQRALLDITKVSAGRLAPRNTAAVFALALCFIHGDVETRRAAAVRLPEICRTATDLFSFLDHMKVMGKWNRVLRRAVADWYRSKTGEQIAYQMVKYRERHGWTHRDAIAACHLLATPQDRGAHWHAAVYWAIDRANVVREGDVALARQDAWKSRPDAPALLLPTIINGHELAMAATDTDVLAYIIQAFKLPHECVKDEFRDDWRVWNALLPQMQPHAMIRQLGKMTSIGLIAKGSPGEAAAVRKLTEDVSRVRVHPFGIFLARTAYARGIAGMRAAFGGNALKWSPSVAVLEALDRAFEARLGDGAIPGAKILAALDVSGSMTNALDVGTGVTAAQAGAAMLYTLVKANPSTVDMLRFDTGAEWIEARSKESVSGFSQRVVKNGGGTDLAQPIVAAMNMGAKYDAIVIATDNETWAGHGHAHEWLANYRAKHNPACRLVVLSMTAGGAQLVPDTDHLSLGIGGLSADIPQVVRGFVTGEF